MSIDTYNYKLTTTKNDIDNIDSLYTSYVSSLTTPTNTTGSVVANSSVSYALAKFGTGWSINYNDEGGIGIFNSTNAIRTSGLVYRPVASYTREPDWEVIFHFDNINHVFQSFKCSHDTNRLVAMLSVTAGSFPFSVLIVFNKTTRSFERICFNNTAATPPPNTLFYNVRLYDRYYEPMSFTSYSVEEAKSFLIDHVGIKDITVGEYQVVDSIRVTSYNVDINQSIPTDRVNVNYVKTNAFIEGVSSIDFNAMITANNNYYLMTFIKNSVSVPFSIFDITYGSYTKRVESSMIPGHISGDILNIECDRSRADYYIYCYREYDNLLIGRYKIDADYYVIPNLECNTYYNLILVDNNRVYESIMSSHRKPEPYDVILPVSELISLSINGNMIRWELDGFNFDYLNIYASMDLFTYPNRDSSGSVVKSRGYGYSATIDVNKKYYMVDVVYKGQTSRPKFVQIY